MDLELRAALASATGLSAADPQIWRALRRFERAALPIVGELWGLAGASEQELWPLLHSALQRPADPAGEARRRSAALGRLLAGMGQGAGPGAAAVALHPQLWLPAYERDHHDTRQRVAGHLLLGLAEHCLTAISFPARPAAIAGRVVELALLAGRAEAADLGHCVGLLIDLEPAAGAPLLEALARGDARAAWRAAVELAGQGEPPAPPPDLAAPTWAEPAARLGQLWRAQGSRLALPLAGFLHRRGRLDQASLERLLAALPDGQAWIEQAVSGAPRPWAAGAREPDPELRAALAPLLSAARRPAILRLPPRRRPARPA